MESRTNYKVKGRIPTPTCIKELNMNIINNFDTSFNSKKTLKDGFNEVTKVKRNFK